MRVPRFPNCKRLHQPRRIVVSSNSLRCIKLQRIGLEAKSQRCLLGDHTSFSSAKSPAASVDATSASLSDAEKRSVTYTSVIWLSSVSSVGCARLRTIMESGIECQGFEKQAPIIGGLLVVLS